MLDWKFVKRKFLRDNKYIHDLNAPAVWAMKDTFMCWFNLGTGFSDLEKYKSY
jgi:hypothetical protein